MAGGLCLTMAALTQGSGKIGLFWPFMFHLLNSIGFAHILRVSLALFAKVAPKSINATIIGLFYLAFFTANAIVGWIGGPLLNASDTNILADPRRQFRHRTRGFRIVQNVRRGPNDTGGRNTLKVVIQG